MKALAITLALLAPFIPRAIADAGKTTEVSVVESVHHTLDLSQAQREQQPIAAVETTLRPKGKWCSELALWLYAEIAPGALKTRQYYGFDHLQVHCGDVELTATFDDAIASLGHDRLLITRIPATSAPIKITYTLDLSRTKAMSGDQLSFEYKDRIVGDQNFIAARGDVLLAPTGYDIDRGREFAPAPDHTYTIHYEVKGPPCARAFHVNAPSLQTVERRGADKAPAWTWHESSTVRAFAGRRWLGVLGDLAIETYRPKDRPDATPIKIVTLQRYVGRPSVTASQAHAIARKTVEAFDALFDNRKLRGALAVSGLGLTEVDFIVLPLPPGVRGAGGQYGRGTCYVYHSVGHDWPLRAKGAHEYYHVFNDGSYAHQRDANLWFGEGYTEAQSVLTALRLMPEPAFRRQRMLIGELGRYLETMNRAPERDNPFLRRLANDGVLTIARDPVLAWARHEDLAAAPSGTDRLIRGRSFLACLLLSLAFEEYAPRRRGFDDWFEQIHSRFGYRPAPKNRASGPMPTYQDLRAAAMAAMPDPRGRRRIDALLARLIESHAPYGYEDLKREIVRAQKRGTLVSILQERD